MDNIGVGDNGGSATPLTPSIPKLPIPAIPGILILIPSVMKSFIVNILFRPIPIPMLLLPL